MKVVFTAKYGNNKIKIPLPNGETITTEFVAKYGYNKVYVATNPIITIDFYLKYGQNSVDVEIPEDVRPRHKKHALTNAYTDKVTIYNYIVSDIVNEEERFDRFVIDKCLIYNQLTESADDTVQKLVNTQNVVTKDVEHYKSPVEYKRLPVDLKEDFYTVQVDDFIVLGEVDDVVTTSAEFRNLQKKYKDNGFLVTAVSAYLKGTRTNNIHIMHA